MRPQPTRRSLATLAAVAIAFSLSGCQGYLVFTTATTFGLDISQQANQTPHVVLGYKRGEVASIPASRKNASATEDTYSVLAYFCAKYDPILSQSTTDSLQIRSVFTTGMAAQTAASNTDMQRFFAEAAMKKIVGGSEPSDKKCF
jgi:hypothetical protein